PGMGRERPAHRAVGGGGRAGLPAGAVGDAGPLRGHDLPVALAPGSPLHPPAGGGDTRLVQGDSHWPMRPSLLASLLALALLVTVVAVALAAPGDIDSGFGNGGRRVLDYQGEDAANDVVVQPDGKIVTVAFGGDPTKIKVTRLDTGGNPDSGFGSGGTVTV